MTNKTHETTAESDPGSLQPTRRTALRGVGLVGSLAMGVGTVSARHPLSNPTDQQVQRQDSTDNETVPVTWENYPRARCHAAFQTAVNRDGFGQFDHLRDLAPIDDQLSIQQNRDTLYSMGVFDLTEPVTITKPDTCDRYQSMNVQNEDQYVKLSVTDPGTYTITREMIGTRYAGVGVRTFVDPNDPDDVRQARQRQDEVVVEQSSAGSFEIPDWDQQSYRRINDALITVGLTFDDFSDAFGDVEEVDPVKFFIASTAGWTGVPEPSQALILQRTPARNDGETPYTLTVEDVPVDAFWSVTVYNDDWYLAKNEYDAYSINDVTAERADDGSVTIHFGGDSEQPNYLYTPERWNYMVRLYQPREPILDGSYQFPEAQPVE
jgi:hypothetical protein